MADTLRSGIGDLVNDLNKVRNNTTNAQQQQDLQKILNVLFMLWQQVIVDTLDANDAKYKTALASLNDAEKSAQQAVGDMSKVANAIATATTAAKALDKVVNVAAKFLV
jgi:folylpolyglutamate synthase/dihydropteroate synthase